MRKTIFKKIKAHADQPFVWRVEGAAYPYGVKTTWSRSTPGSKLTLDTGVLVAPKIDLGVYDKKAKHREIDLSDGGIIFLHPTEITLTTPGNATVLIALDVEMKDPNSKEEKPAVRREERQFEPVKRIDLSAVEEDDKLKPVERGELRVLTEEQLGELPLTPVDITVFAKAK